MRLPEDSALIFAPGTPPIFGTKIRYHLDQDFSARAKVPPPRHSDRIGAARKWPETLAPVTSSRERDSQETRNRHSGIEPKREERDRTQRDASREWLFK